MTFFFKKVLALLKAFVTYCPYCLAGKKAVQVASGEKIKKESKPTERERNLMEGMKTGRNIAIIGVFCPFFWVSLFTVSSQVKPATFRHKPYNILLLGNSLPVLKSVAVSCHV